MVFLDVMFHYFQKMIYDEFLSSMYTSMVLYYKGIFNYFRGFDRGNGWSHSTNALKESTSGKITILSKALRL